MDCTHILESLNDKQREAVTAPVGNQLILAGAGSGKTRVLVHRIAWLIQVEQMSPFAILAVTFTNKAAAEMRARTETLLQIPTRGMWVGTFHGLAHRLLRAHWQDANLPENFQILDSDDQYRLIRRVLKTLELDESNWSPRNCQWFINGQKDLGNRPHHIHAGNDVHLKTMQRIYELYEESCRRGGLIDFAEILLRTHELWINHPNILQHYQQRFQYILVDEFQDTNTIQYAWLKLLTGENGYITSVGDDDQSIYGWRGAKIKHIQRFAKEFPNVSTIRLEQNYRSTGTILAAANALITHNDERMGKNLWTSGEQGELISLYAAFNEIDEARYIVNTITSRKEQDSVYSDFAILYRSNAQSRVIEEALIYAGIPYRVYGGFRFFDRAEIKDALAYLRLIVNRDDDAAFERINNMPPRGIGDKTLAELRLKARTDSVSLWQAATKCTENKELSARAHNALVNFLKLIDDLAECTAELTLHEQCEQAIHISELWEHYSKTKSEKAQTKLDNLQELMVACKHYKPDEDETLPPLVTFLSHAALEAGENQSDANQDCVQLMTLHAAKGLEFPIVLITGVEEGLFPHQMSVEEPGRLEEERRLCYVGITRAMKKLYISYAEIRRQYGTENYHRPSRFIREIPAQYLEEVRMTTRPAGNNYKTTQTSKRKVRALPDAAGDTGFKLGQPVQHAKFGEGVIVNFEGRGNQARVQVQFANAGLKWLVLSYAKLETRTV